MKLRNWLALTRNLLFALPLLAFVFIASCAPVVVTPIDANIVKIDVKEARQRFIIALLNEESKFIQKVSTQGLPGARMHMLLYPYANHIAYEKKYKFVGAKNTSNDSFFVFLFENAGNGTSKDYAVYAFRLGLNPTVKFNQVQQGDNLWYSMEVDGISYCVGGIVDMPKINDTYGEVRIFNYNSGQGVGGLLFSSSGTQGPMPKECYGKEFGTPQWTFSGFESREELIDFAQIFASSFPKIKVIK